MISMMRKATTFILPLCIASIQTSGASSSAAASSLFGQRRPLTAFCSPTNSSTSKQARSAATNPTPLKAADNNNEGNEETKGKGTWNPFSLAVLKIGLTEPAWTSPFNYKDSAGTYVCANCGSPLFSSSGKYDSGSGWPSFWKTVESDRVSLSREWDGRIECKCANCDGHLGHVFPDGPQRGDLDVMELATVPESDPNIGYKAQKGSGSGDGESKFSRMPRYCVNGVAMRFEEEAK